MVDEVGILGKVGLHIMKITPYEFLKNQCGLDKVVSVGSMHKDLLYYYNQPWKANEVMTMASIVENYLNEFWNTYKNKVKGKKLSEGIKLIRPDDGIYPYVIKVDFNRAFVNYAIRVMSPPLYKIFRQNCIHIAVMNIPLSAKKFLYNYILTNLIIRYDGVDTLYQLRQTVYNDVMTLAHRYGEPLKSEVDGCYVKCTKDTFSKIYIYDDIFGAYKIIRIWRYIVLGNGMVTIAGLMGGKDRYQIKGINKDTCNVIADTLAQVVLKTDDKILDNFFTNPRIDIIDWCNKSKDGTQVQILAKGSNVMLKTETEDDILNLYSVRDVLDRDKYYMLMERYITEFFELWTPYAKKKEAVAFG